MNKYHILFDGTNARPIRNENKFCGSTPTKSSAQLPNAASLFPNTVFGWSFAAIGDLSMPFYHGVTLLHWTKTDLKNNDERNNNAEHNNHHNSAGKGWVKNPNVTWLLGAGHLFSFWVRSLIQLLAPNVLPKSVPSWHAIRRQAPSRARGLLRRNRKLSSTPPLQQRTCRSVSTIPPNTTAYRTTQRNKSARIRSKNASDPSHTWIKGADTLARHLHSRRLESKRDCVTSWRCFDDAIPIRFNRQYII